LAGVGRSSVTGRRVVVVGDRIDGFEPQDTIAPAIEHAATALGVDAPVVEWLATDELERSGTGVLEDAAAVWCAPGGPYRSPAGAFAGIGWARRCEVPFLGTCAGFQHAVVEFARSVLGHDAAGHAEYDDTGDDLFITSNERLCSLTGQTMPLTIVDGEVAGLYGTTAATERYYCRFGVNPDRVDDLQRAGLVVAGVDAIDGDVRMLRLAGHPFFVLTLFVPQTASQPLAPHPLVTGFVRAALGLGVAAAAR
jgi:CTP synthase (UTP-ammonia lyase)